MDFPKSLASSGFEAPAEAMLDGEVLGLGDLGGLEHGLDARHIDSHGFFDKGVLASFDRSTEVLGAEARRSGKQDEIDSGIDDILVSIKTDEATLGGALHLFSETLGGADGVFHSGTKGVTHGPKDDIWVSGQGLGDRTVTPTTTTDETDFDRCVGIALSFQDRGCSESERSCRSGFKKVTSVWCVHDLRMTTEFVKRIAR